MTTLFQDEPTVNAPSERGFFLCSYTFKHYLPPPKKELTEDCILYDCIMKSYAINEIFRTGRSIETESRSMVA